jgi:hypothetical protein
MHLPLAASLTLLLAVATANPIAVPEPEPLSEALSLDKVSKQASQYFNFTYPTQFHKILSCGFLSTIGLASGAQHADFVICAAASSGSVAASATSRVSVRARRAATARLGTVLVGIRLGRNVLVFLLSSGLGLSSGGSSGDRHGFGVEDGVGGVWERVRRGGDAL